VAEPVDLATADEATADLPAADLPESGEATADA